LGLLSPDLRDHAVVRFLRPIANHAAAYGLELLCYHVGTQDDSHSAWLRARATIFRHEPHTSQSQLAEIIRRDGPDVLIDLAGHTRQNRLATMQRRPAPIQATYLGYPTTTGLSTIDARITDDSIDPPGTEHLCTERVLRLEGCSHCFDPGDDLPAVTPRPPAAPVVFASVGTMLKHNRHTTDLWASVLKAVPDSRLFIKNPGTREAAVRAEIAARFAARGIDPTRIEVRPPVERPMEAYADIDIVLDTFPYNGTTTTCEALWMGVPVVSMRGETHASRVGASLLGAVGLADWSVSTPDEFAATASWLAADRVLLARTRAGLRDRVTRSPLGDSAGFTARFCAAVRSLVDPIHR
jgi:predicted O-linked N-acetylglucosamine transferase (SPINDLY family)